MRVAYDPPRSKHSAERGGYFFTMPTEKHKTATILQKYRILQKSTEYYKPERILQVFRRIAVRHCERKFESCFTFPTISPPARPSTPAISQSTAVGHLPQDDYGSAPSSFPAVRVPGDGKVRPLHRAGAYPPQERAGVRTRGRVSDYGRPPSRQPVSVFLPLPRIRAKKKSCFGTKTLDSRPKRYYNGTRTRRRPRRRSGKNETDTQ